MALAKGWDVGPQKTGSSLKKVSCPSHKQSRVRTASVWNEWLGSCTYLFYFLTKLAPGRAGTYRSACTGYNIFYFVPSRAPVRLSSSGTLISTYFIIPAYEYVQGYPTGGFIN